MKKLTDSVKVLNDERIKEIRGGSDPGGPLPAINCVYGCDSHCGTKKGSKGGMYESTEEFVNDET